MAYQALELGQAGNPACPDKYTEESTLLATGSRRLILQISAQAVFIQFGTMPQGKGAGLGSVVWQTEMPFLPVVGILPKHFDAVRVRNYTPGAKAQVMLTPTVEP